MSRTSVPSTLRYQVIAEFGGRCAYCHTATGVTGARLVIDHIIPEAAGGATKLENLCLACHSCNEFKGAKLEAEDPSTGQVLPLYNPRSQLWRDHFVWSDDSTEIVGLTPTGRATIAALNMNHFEIVEARRRWASIGWHPPLQDR